LHRSDEKDTLPFTLFAVPADFKSKAVYSHGSSLVETEPANENDASKSLRVGKVKMNFIY
jgi:hypothetical protein